MDKALPNGGLWFSPLDNETGKIDPLLNVTVNNGRPSRVKISLKIWSGKVGLPYRNPHSFRHGHAVYAIQNSNDLSDLKAISMNLIYENLQVTDGVYGVLSGVDTKQIINKISKQKINNPSNLVVLLEELLKELKQERG